jgi:hypothetical protein
MREIDFHVTYLVSPKEGNSFSCYIPGLSPGGKLILLMHTCSPPRRELDFDVTYLVSPRIEINFPVTVHTWSLPRRKIGFAVTYLVSPQEEN